MTNFGKLLMQHTFEVVLLAIEYPFQQHFPFSSPLSYAVNVTCNTRTHPLACEILWVKMGGKPGTQGISTQS